MKAIIKIRTSVIFMLMIAINFSCKKDKPSPSAPDALVLLQNKNWKISAITASPAYFGITDVFNGLYSDCEKDDIYIFQANGPFVLDAGALQCDTVFAQRMMGNWNYNSTTKNLHFDLVSEGITQDMTISVINANAFTASSEDTLPDGTHTITWKFITQ